VLREELFEPALSGIAGREGRRRVEEERARHDECEEHDAQLRAPLVAAAAQWERREAVEREGEGYGRAERVWKRDFHDA